MHFVVGHTVYNIDTPNNNYEFTPDRRDRDEDPMENFMLLKFNSFVVELFAAADISVETVVTFPAKPIHFSWVFR